MLLTEDVPTDEWPWDLIHPDELAKCPANQLKWPRVLTSTTAAPTAWSIWRSTLARLRPSIAGEDSLRVMSLLVPGNMLTDEEKHLHFTWMFTDLYSPWTSCGSSQAQQAHCCGLQGCYLRVWGRQWVSTARHSEEQCLFTLHTGCYRSVSSQQEEHVEWLTPLWCEGLLMVSVRQVSLCRHMWYTYRLLNMF